MYIYSLLFSAILCYTLVHIYDVQYRTIVSYLVCVCVCIGLFFITTGASVQPNVIQDELPTVLALLAGLISFKAIIITALGPLFQLTRTESIRTGSLLSGGGEFAFVVLTLADKLHVLPDKLAKILVGVVVLSMALTPYLSNLGDKVIYTAYC